MEEKNIFQKLQEVRVAVNKICNKKTGKNQYFDYFQLDDFLSIANEEFLKVGLTPIFTITKKQFIKSENVQGEYVTRNYDNEEIAQLQICDGNGAIVFETPTAQAKLNSNNPIQELGAKHTYLKRYLYMNALELSEGDIVDASHEEKPKEIKATEKQINLIKELGSQKQAWLKGYMAKNNLNSLDDLTVKQASDLIEVLKNG